MSELHQRLIIIARMVAETKRRRAAVIKHDPVERQRYNGYMAGAGRVDRMADNWSVNDNAERYTPLQTVTENNP